MGRTFRVICENKIFCICATREQATHSAERLKSRGHVTWIEPAAIEPTLAPPVRPRTIIK